MQRFSGLVQLASRVVFEQTQSRLALQVRTRPARTGDLAGTAKCLAPCITVSPAKQLLDQCWLAPAFQPSSRLA